MRGLKFNIPVLVYHHINPHAGDTVTVTPEVFAGQMQFLQDEGYQTLSADELMESFYGKKRLVMKSAVITFDDGWLDNYFYAVPVLKKHHYKATFFIVTSRADAASMRKWSDSDIVPEHAVAKKLSDSGDAGQVVLGWDMINSLEKSGLFRFFSHGVTHRKCADLSPRELQVELVDSKECIERRLGKRCDYFCWPYGSFSADTVSAAKDAGYKALFTTLDGFCEPGSDPDMIQRIEVENSVLWLKNRLSEEKS